ncbi:hypothetical protein AB0M38_33625 [Streptomyces sp. NPDC051742]|uniref:hypothetical protein n=1 Tax=unclassified Streptomyces TaxID=2593676 RepID=UPI00342880B7
MKRGHAEILGTHQPEHQRITNLVQSTDQALHRAIGIGAAALTTWLATRPRARR